MYKHVKIIIILFAALLWLLCATLCHGEEFVYKKLISDIDRYIEVGDSESLEVIIAQIEKEGRKVSPLLVKKITEPDIPEKAMAVYVWAVGFTKDPNVADELIGIYENNPSKTVKWNALQSLARIGDNKAGEYLLSIAKSTQDKPKDEDQHEKFNILDLLAEMQYEKALPEMEEILRKDCKQYYWQSIFCFGKMGDKSIPYLLNKINDPDKNVRFNSMNMLGPILLATEATEPFIKRYWIEEDTEIRMLILSSLERIIPDLAKMKSFFEEVATKEDAEEPKKYAQETVDNLELYQQRVNSFRAKKKNDNQCFEKEYALLYKSAGKQGNIKTLGIYSTPEDEAKLKELRQQILTRNSDECFYDCEEVNKIIMWNRLITQNKDLSTQKKK